MEGIGCTSDATMPAADEHNAAAMNVEKWCDDDDDSTPMHRIDIFENSYINLLHANGVFNLTAVRYDGGWPQMCGNIISANSILVTMAFYV